MSANNKATDNTKALNRIPFVPFFCVLLFCLYFSTVSHLDILPWFGPYNEKRILELLLLLTVGFLSVCDPVSRNNGLAILSHLPDWSKSLLLLISALGLISSVGAGFPQYALLEVSLFTLLFAISLCVASCYVQLGNFFNKMVAIALFLTGWAYLSGFLGYYITALSGDTTFSQRDLFGNFSNIRFFSQFQSWTLSLIVLPLLLFKNRSLFITVLLTTIAIFWWFLLFTSGTRGTLLGCFIAIPFAFLITGKQAKSWIRWQIVAITGGIIAYFLFFFLIPAILSIDIRSVLNNTINRNIAHSSGRMEIWSAAGDMIQNNPWFGVGPMHYAASESISIVHPHNSLLQIAAEWGLPVALFVIVLAVWALVGCHKTIKSKQISKDDENIYAALVASLVTGIVHSLFSGIIVMPLSQIMMVLVAGWLLGISSQCNIADIKVIKHSQLKKILPFVVMIALGLGIIWPLFPELLYVEKLQTEFIASHPEKKQLHPRFWQFGKLKAPYKEDIRAIRSNLYP